MKRNLAVILLLFGLVTLPATHAWAFDFALHGYLRQNLEYYHDLDTQTRNALVNQGGTLGDNDQFGTTLFSQQRLRTDATIKLHDNLTIHGQVDVFDNIVFGTNENEQFNFVSPIVGETQIPGPGGSVSMNGPDDIGKFNAFNVRRIYGDILTPLGKFRIGRQQSHFGLGIFQNDGNDPEDDFGDTFDRIAFLSSVDLSEMVGGVIKESKVLSFGGVVDMAFSDNQDPRDTGLGNVVNGPGRNLWQFALIGLYDQPRFSIGAFTGVRYRDGKEGEKVSTARPILVDDVGDDIQDADLNAQLADPIAAGNDGDTVLYFIDLYSKLNFTDEVSLEGEYVFMNGDLSTGLALDAIPFNGLPPSAKGPIELPNQNSFRVHLGALELKGDHDFGKWIVQGGYASGDTQPLSSRVTQFGFRPDYQIALLLFRVPLGSSPRVSQENGTKVGSRVLVGAVPVTGNFVNNAAYLATGYDHKFNLKSLGKQFGKASAGIKAITAWAPSDTFNVDFAEITGFSDLPQVVNSNKWYGVEVDANFRMQLFEHLTVLLEAGYLYAGPVFDVEVEIFDPNNLGLINVVPFDSADDVFGSQLTLFWEF